MEKLKQTKLLALTIIVLMLAAIFQLPVMADTKDNVILEKAEGYLIYYKDICNNEFEFAFSNDSAENVENLVFKSSAKDSTSEGALNIAYVDQALKDTYFNDVTKSTYLWIRNLNDEMLVTADKIDLSKALNDDMIEVVNDTTKRIKVDTTQKNQKEEMIDGVKTTITVGKVVIDEPKQDAKYYYQLIPVDAENAEATELFNLAEQLKTEITGTYESLSLSKKFYDLYQQLMPDARGWTLVENNEILQPEEARKDDKYIVYLKEETDPNTYVVDAKFLVCDYTPEEGVDQTTVEEIVKLPVTFDSGTILFITLGIIVLALVIVAIIKRTNKKEENK